MKPVVSAALTGAMLMVGVSAWAVPAAPGLSGTAGKRTCFLNKAEAMKKARGARAFNKYGAPQAPPAVLNPKVLVIRVDFDDRTMATSAVNTGLFFDEVRDFYVENSYGGFTPQFTISTCTVGCGVNGAFRLPEDMSYYGSDACGQVVCQQYGDLFDDARTAAQADGWVLSNFDHIMVYHAGNGQETSGSSPDLWSVYLPTNTAGIGNSRDFTVVPETEAGGYDPLGVICHEYGHQLGLPDLYDTSAAGGQTTVGAWDLMDYPYMGSPPGSNPPHLGAWSKKFLGFATVTERNSAGPLSLSPAETSKTSFVKIPIPGASANEYFLVEYRLATSTAAYDEDVPMSGLAIWHVDDDIALGTPLTDNTVNTPSLSGRGHRGVDLVEKDNISPDLSRSDVGTNDAFTDNENFTSPQSNAFNGAGSGVAIAKVSGVGGNTVTASLAIIQAAAGLSVAKVINYPNPAGDPQKYPVRTGAPSGTVTTLVLQLSKPVVPGDMELDIFNVAGERVFSVGGSALQLKVGEGEPSEDYKWVYEYDWNGKNASGDKVAPGVYLYRFKADDEVKVGKAVIVR
jgi:M6 family metalloprotease-like protein